MIWVGGAINGQSLTSHNTLNILTYQSCRSWPHFSLWTTMLLLKRPGHSPWPLSGLSLLFFLPLKNRFQKRRLDQEVTQPCVWVRLLWKDLSTETLFVMLQELEESLWRDKPKDVAPLPINLTFFLFGLQYLTNNNKPTNCSANYD